MALLRGRGLLGRSLGTEKVLVGRWSVNDKIVLGRWLGLESMVMGMMGRRRMSSSGGRVVVTGLGTVRQLNWRGEF